MPVLKKIPWLGGGSIFLFFICSIFAPFITPYDPVMQDLSEVLVPPFWLEGGSTSHILGTDMMGRDIMSRIIYGARISLVVAFSAVLLSSFFGTCLGLISGYMGGRVDTFIMGLTDTMLSMPYVLLAIAIIGVLGPKLENIIIVFAITNWVGYTRLVRGEVLSIKEREFIDLAVIGSCSTIRILLVHILPNVANAIIVLCTLDIGKTVIFEAAMSYLGLGVPPTTPSWGSMLADGRIYLTHAWWLATFPGFAILFTVLGANLLGDWLRDFLDPKQKVKMR